MKRIYTVVKQRDFDNVIDLHASFSYNPSQLAYVDVYWTGAQWSHLRNTGVPYVAGELTLDKFRTEFMGRQIGVAAETVTHRLLTENQKASQIAATSYLHDVPVRLRMLAVDHVELIFNIWKMRDKFGAKEAKKLFYWNNQDYVTLSPEKCNSIT